VIRLVLRVIRAVFGCSHPCTYRERRRLHGVQVMHFVCEDCGHATPAVDRTASEHRRVVKVGERRSVRLLRQSNIETINRRRA
jgi:hypothetical protein